MLTQQVLEATAIVITTVTAGLAISLSTVFFFFG